MFNKRLRWIKNITFLYMVANFKFFLLMGPDETNVNNLACVLPLLERQLLMTDELRRTIHLR